MSRSSGTFLSPRLFPGTCHLTPRFNMRPRMPCVRSFAIKNLLYQSRLPRNAKNTLRKFQGPRFFSFWVVVILTSHKCLDVSILQFPAQVGFFLSPHLHQVPPVSGDCA